MTSAGTFLSDVAAIGITTASSISIYSADRRLRRLSSSISHSATLLHEISQIIFNNESYFKPSFAPTFAKVAERSRKGYELVLTALEDVMLKERNGSAIVTEVELWNQYDRFVSALNVCDGIGGFLSELEDSFDEITMLHSVVMLVVIQCHAKERNLTPTEQSQLCILKSGIGELLEELRDAEIANVVAFSLLEPTIPANRTQLWDDAESEMSTEDCGSSTAASINICISSEKTLVMSPEPNIPSLITESRNDTIIYEVYQISNSERSKQRSFHLFGMQVTVSRKKRDRGPQLQQLHPTQEEIRSFIEASITPSNLQRSSSLDPMSVLPSTISQAINTILSKKNNPPQAHLTTNPHTWSLHHILTPKPLRPLFHCFRSAKPTQTTMILKGTPLKPQTIPPPPPLPSYPNEAPPSPLSAIVIQQPREESSRRRRRRNAACIELTQEETEKVVNDFVAGVSYLYDGNEVEDRGRALRNCKGWGRDEQEENGSDCDGSFIGD